MDALVVVGEVLLFRSVVLIPSAKERRDPIMVVGRATAAAKDETLLWRKRETLLRRPTTVTATITEPNVTQQRTTSLGDGVVASFLIVYKYTNKSLSVLAGVEKKIIFEKLLFKKESADSYFSSFLLLTINMVFHHHHIRYDSFVSSISDSRG